jgi:hypothetical protein
MPDPAARERRFPEGFNDTFATGGDEGNRAFFGTDVLGGLVEGIDEFIELRQERWRQFRSMGPVVLGSAMWIDDEQLLEVLGRLSAACVVVSKQARTRRENRKLEALAEANERIRGLPIKAFPGLGGLAPKVDGKPVMVGPYDPMDETVLPAIRTLGYRKRGDLVPIIHAKLALLGHFWWYDEGPAGQVGDFVGFTARRLWISSANFTVRSRRSLEVGYWTEDHELINGAERFLIKLIRSSEALDPDADSLDPELAAVEFDDLAMAQAAAELIEDPEEDLE